MTDAEKLAEIAKACQAFQLVNRTILDALQAAHHIVTETIPRIIGQPTNDPSKGDWPPGMTPDEYRKWMKREYNI